MRDNSISILLHELPNECTSKDLIRIGIFKNSFSLWRARKRGQSPDYMKFGGKIFYIKKSVISYAGHMHEKDTPQFLYTPASFAGERFISKSSNSIWKFWRWFSLRRKRQCL